MNLSDPHAKRESDSPPNLITYLNRVTAKRVTRLHCSIFAEVKSARISDREPSIVIFGTYIHSPLTALYYL